MELTLHDSDRDDFTAKTVLVNGSVLEVEYKNAKVAIMNIYLPLLRMRTGAFPAIHALCSWTARQTVHAAGQRLT